MKEQDDLTRTSEARELISQKKALNLLYRETYAKFAECLSRCPKEGMSLELGSGGGFIKKIIPEMITSDVLPHDGIDQVIDATYLPFKDQSLNLICMMNVFHHITDVKSFLKEAQRCLLPGGRIFIMDQHPGYIGWPIYKYLHCEPFNPHSKQWNFEASSPLSGANGALTWMVFVRDIDNFTAQFPLLKLEKYRPHTPLRYWLAGGLKNWSLLPAWAFSLSLFIDRALIRVSSNLGSFVDIELVKRANF